MEDNFKALKEILRGDLIIGSITHENAPPGKDCYEDCGVLKDASGNPLGKQGGKHKRCMDCWNEYIDKLATQIDALYQKPIRVPIGFDKEHIKQRFRTKPASQPDDLLLSDEELQKIYPPPGTEKYPEWDVCDGCPYPLMARKAQLAHCTPLIEARERERILRYLKGLLGAHPNASLAATIDVIETEGKSLEALKGEPK